MTALDQLVVCSLEGWDDVWRRNQFLADRLLRRYAELRILFVEPATDPIHDLRSLRRPKRPRLRSVDGDGRLRALRPLKPLPRVAGPIADLALRGEVVAVTRALGFDRPVLWLNDVTYAPLIRRAGWPAVYDVTDDWLLAPGSARERRRLRRLDELALHDAAEVVVCSRELARSRGASRPVTLVPNAVDAEHFRRPRRRPVDLPSSPVAVYAGSLHDARLDVELVVELARTLRALSIVLVGPDSLSERSRASLTAEPNVRLLGRKSYDDVPAYLQHADVIVVPHRVDAFTESLDPIKAYECLAVERAVVATPVAGFRELCTSFAVVERSTFVDAVRGVLDAGVSRRPGGRIPSWEERTEVFAAALERAAAVGPSARNSGPPASCAASRQRSSWARGA